MRALVTGGAGFIGSHICDRLIQEGYEVAAIDNEFTGRRKNVHPQVKYTYGDIAWGADYLRWALPGPFDLVCHLAAVVSNIKSARNPTHAVQTNIQGTINVLEYCIAKQVPRMLYASSAVVYGRLHHVPTAETEPCKPISYYGVTKYAAERLVHVAAEHHGFDATSFRMFSVYGPRQRLDDPYQGVLGIFIGNVVRGEPIAIHGDGEQSRDFVYVLDVADTWIRAIDKPATYGEVYNLGAGRLHTINQLAAMVLRCFGLAREDYPIEHTPELPGDQRHLQSDNRKLWEHTRWRDYTPFEAGLAQTVSRAREGF